MGRVPQTTVGWSEPAIFRNFGRLIFGTFTVEANIIMRRHEVPYWLPSDSLTLSDTDMSFYAKICLHHRSV